MRARSLHPARAPAPLAALLGALAASCVPLSMARSQVEASVAAEAGRATYVGYEPSGVVTLTTDLAWTGAWARVAAGGALSRFESGSHLIEGSLAGSLLSPRLGPAQVELAAGARGTDYRDEYRTTRWGGEARLHLAGATAGAWAGAGLGRASLELGDRGTRRAAAGLWWLPRPAALPGELTLRATAERVRWGELSGDASIPGGDWRALSGGLGWRAGRVELDAMGARRWGDSAGTAWDVAAAVWVLERVAVEGSAGRSLFDPAQELQGGRFATLGLRVRLGDAPRRAVRPAPGPEPFEVRDAGAGARAVVVRAAGARSVEIMADFTDWQPVPLARGRDGAWTVALPISPGPHRVNVRVDGGAWSVPAGLAAVPDDFGAMAGVVVVP